MTFDNPAADRLSGQEPPWPEQQGTGEADGVESVLADLDTVPDGDGQAGETSDEPSRRPRFGGAAKGAGRALIRRVANKAQELSQAPEDRVETLAGLLGTTTDLSELTVAVMTAPTSALTAVRDLTSAHEAIKENPFAAGLTIAELGRPRIKAVWSLLGNLGVSLPKTMPASDAKAALTLAEKVNWLDPATLEELSQVVALSRKR